VNKFILLLSLIVSQVFGNIWLSRGMRQVGEIRTFDPLTLLAVGLQVLTNSWIWLGIVCLIIALLLYLNALSRLELSYVLPITALSYGLNALFANFILGETISPNRWIGTSIITIGVVLVSLSETAKNNQSLSQSSMPASHRKRFLK
jgi:transporter family protein